MRQSRARRIALLATVAVLGASAVAIAASDEDTPSGVRAGVEVKTIPGSLSDAQAAAAERRAGIPVREAPIARIPSDLTQSFSAFRSGTVTAAETRTVSDATRGGVNRSLARNIPTKAGASRSSPAERSSAWKCKTAQQEQPAAAVALPKPSAAP